MRPDGDAEFPPRKKSFALAKDGNRLSLFLCLGFCV